MEKMSSLLFSPIKRKIEKKNMFGKKLNHKNKVKSKIFNYSSLGCLVEE